MYNVYENRNILIEQCLMVFFFFFSEVKKLCKNMKVNLVSIELKYFKQVKLNILLQRINFYLNIIEYFL